MRRIRIAAAGLLGLTGLLQILEIAAPDADPSAVITALFGGIYDVIAFYLFRNSRPFIYLGAVVPLAGLLYAIATLILLPGPQTVFFIAADLVAATCCGFLIYKTV